MTRPRGGRTPSPHRSPIRSRRRLRAAAVLVLVVGLSVSGTVAVVRLRTARMALPETPFAPGAMVATGPDGRSVTLPIDSAFTLLYVSAHCRYCRAELAAWSATTATGAGGPAPIAVFAPDSSPEEMTPLVRGYPGPVLLDTDGTVGRALRAPAVPFTAEIRAGRVVRVAVGVTRGAERARPPSSAVPFDRGGVR